MLLYIYPLLALQSWQLLTGGELCALSDLACPVILRLAVMKAMIIMLVGMGDTQAVGIVTQPKSE